MRKKLIIILFLIVTMVQLVMPITVSAAEDIEVFEHFTLHKEDYKNDEKYKNMKHIWYEPNDKEGDSIPLIVWIHGKKTKWSTTTLRDGFPSILETWEREGFNAYVLCPQLNGPKVYGSGDNWANEGIQDALKSLIDYFVDKHKDIDPNNIILIGHSDGGVGALHIANSPLFDNYFSRLVVLSGVNHIGELNIKIPTVVMCGKKENQEYYYNSIISSIKPTELIQYSWPDEDHNSYIKPAFYQDTGEHYKIERNCRQWKI